MKFLTSAVVASTLLLGFASVSASEAKFELQQRLAPVSTLQADFVQQVIDPQGELVQELQGRLAMARPNKFFWQSDAPNELVLVADGTTLYYFDPFVEQVTVAEQQASATQSPFLLLLDGETTAWADYEVEVEGNSYQLEPNAEAESQQSLQINFTDETLNEVILDDGQGQLTRIVLSNVKTNSALAGATFEFEIPPGAAVDDQRGDNE
ncbi:outer membrane lipoprotein chaperone LolA [Pseudidiomarina terrestris]|uniref:Outer-membrane lipoprotein carrier protein n=1 Tax=Pseudidiomarina terrestris TaxID=2820060 RepID=A0AAW7QYC1_9GAMM|nr:MULTISPECIES: outer membrane lipoprotein chaperone LolA [unclassified Pseudidiomarina]MDN7123737.1 outer membrane lipoprotein chaperone LolA [Pseudidiomarina sp. 1APP75-32.1]MDN7128539.1 outer membrane lipoprotein chaperone LolA [Pseudidiomarina sp. 1APR75-15]MDN7135203.1 outer membrane lipoprotein chaperone LolA [Pseudidiomarina sp. 1ASP75-5]MDN7137875.1 outer membrane lipoprotein chaperone LolA [Pseudidiomarina sp. 1ASP75-14]MEA3587017.1 outer membrane lipoprotein chaperone LolA [Pseudidi